MSLPILSIKLQFPWGVAICVVQQAIIFSSLPTKIFFWGFLKEIHRGNLQHNYWLLLFFILQHIFTWQFFHIYIRFCKRCCRMRPCHCVIRQSGPGFRANRPTDSTGVCCSFSSEGVTVCKGDNRCTSAPGCLERDRPKDYETGSQVPQTRGLSLRERNRGRCSSPAVWHGHQEAVDRHYVFPRPRGWWPLV